jgi:dUTP pyrophosphatase
MIKRKIKYINWNKEYKLQQHGAWIDLAVSQEYSLNMGEFKILDLGISMELPKFYEAHVLPRSSTYKNLRLLLANSEGIIDGPNKYNSGYCGTNDRWGFPAKSDVYIIIPKSTRIAQFRLCAQMNAPWYVKMLDLFTTFEFIEVDVLSGENRGGFGKSGV